MKKYAVLLISVSSSLLLIAAQARKPEPVTWSTLKTLDSSHPNSPAKQLNNKVVSVPGFMVPLEDDADEVTEFLLVPFAGACIHVPPPPPNQMIYVKLNAHKKTKMSFIEPIIVTGQLHVTSIQSPYGDVSFNMDGDMVLPYAQ
jgi:hypothetical protein